jgi:hypothetical protein
MRTGCSHTQLACSHILVLGGIVKKIRRMKQTLLLLITLFCATYSTKIFSQNNKLQADSLIKKIEYYIDKNIETEGVIVHICGVNGQKMKLRTNNGEIIKIVPKDSLKSFDASFNKKRVKIQGIVKEFRIDKNEIDKMEKEKKLLCHIDNTPCKDSVWVNNKKKSGQADALSNQDIEKLRTMMVQTGKSYVSIITIFAEKVEIIDDEEK